MLLFIYYIMYYYKKIINNKFFYLKNDCRFDSIADDLIRKCLIAFNY